jgi:hypothetical protein
VRWGSLDAGGLIAILFALLLFRFAIGFFCSLVVSLVCFALVCLIWFVWFGLVGQDEEKRETNVVNEKPAKWW